MYLFNAVSVIIEDANLRSTARIVDGAGEENPTLAVDDQSSSIVRDRRRTSNATKRRSDQQEQQVFGGLHLPSLRRQ